MLQHEWYHTGVGAPWLCVSYTKSHFLAVSCWMHISIYECMYVVTRTPLQGVLVLATVLLQRCLEYLNIILKTNVYSFLTSRNRKSTGETYLKPRCAPLDSLLLFASNSQTKTCIAFVYMKETRFTKLMQFIH
jgi:hypothetical protein